MKHTITLLILTMFVLISCQKDEHEPVLPTIKEPVGGSFIKSITQNGATFQYEISTEATVETGVYISMDSLKLAASNVSGSYFKSSYDANQKKYIAEAVALEPYTTYWYTIKSKYAGSVTFSTISKFVTEGFDVKWQEGFTKKIKLVEPLYRDLILTGENVDTDLNNYEVTYGNMICNLRLINKVQDSPGSFSYHIQVPASAPVGIKKFTIYYKKKKIFEDDLEVEKGNMYSIKKVAQHPDGAADRVYFKYNNQLYTIYLNSDTYHMNLWDPVSNRWERKSMPRGIQLWKGMQGLEIDGKIYFPAFSKSGFYEGSTYIGSQERIYTYDPVNDTWDFYSFYTSDNSEDRLTPLGSFAYQGKFYCFVNQTRLTDGVYKEQRLLKVLDPVNKSWETVMEIKHNAWGYRAIVIQGKIYILETQERNHYSATVDFKYVLYTMDPASGTWTKLGTPIFYTLEKGALDPAIFEYNNHLYVYGGKSSVGYLGYGSTDLYEYAPETNSWTMLFLSPNNAIPSQEHFAYNLNGKVYFGLGQTARSEWNDEIWELNLD